MPVEVERVRSIIQVINYKVDPNELWHKGNLLILVPRRARKTSNRRYLGHPRSMVDESLRTIRVF